MRFHLRFGCTALVLLAVLVTPSFSGLRDKGLKVQTVELPGVEVGNGVVLVQQRYALVTPFEPTTLGKDQAINLETYKTLNNNNVLVFDNQNLREPRMIPLGDCYFPELSVFEDGLAVVEGIGFVEKAGQNGPELQAVNVIVYFWLSFDDDKPNTIRPFRIEIPESDNSTVVEGSSSFARVSDNQLAFMNGTGDLSIYNLDDGSLVTSRSDFAEKGTVAIVGSDQKAGVLAIANQISVTSDDGKVQTHKTEFRFLSVEKSGVISLMRDFSAAQDDPFFVVDGSNVAFEHGPDGSPLAAYCIDNMGNLREFAFQGNGVGTAKKVVQFSGLAQDPNQPYETLCARKVQLDPDNILVHRDGRILFIRRPAFGTKPTKENIRRPAFLRSEERESVVLGRFLKKKHGGLISDRGDISITDMSAAIGDDVSALLPAGPSTWLTILKEGGVFVLGFSEEERSVQMTYQGSLGKGPVVAGAYDSGQLAAIRASAESETPDSAAPGALMIAKLKGASPDAGASIVAAGVGQAGAQLTPPPSKRVAPSIRRPCNLGR